MRKTVRPGPVSEGYVVEFLVKSPHCRFGGRGKLFHKALTGSEYRELQRARRDGEVKIIACSHIRRAGACDEQK